MAKILTQVTSIVHDIRIEKKKSKVQELFVVKWVEQQQFALTGIGYVKTVTRIKTF